MIMLGFITVFLSQNHNNTFVVLDSFQDEMLIQGQNCVEKEKSSDRHFVISSSDSYTVFKNVSNVTDMLLI